MGCTPGNRLARDWATRKESSVDWSSTTMISVPGMSCAITEATARGRTSAALWQGMMTETRQSGFMAGPRYRSLMESKHDKTGIAEIYVPGLALMFYDGAES